MAWVDPNDFFSGAILVVAPHMDDGVLACGGTIARLEQKAAVHVVYATDGSRSPVPTFSWQGSADPNLPRIRKKEARSALAALDVSQANVYFLDFPDGRLERCLKELRAALVALIEQVAPNTILIPFRYDRHPDHLALQRAVVDVLRSPQLHARLVEYFVYYRWRLLPGKDLRRYLRPEQLLKVDIAASAAQKKEALQCFRSQTTCFFAWQDRPILTPERVEEVSRAPELFLEYDPAFAGAKAFSSWSRWIRTVHAIEPPLKRIKDQMLTLLRSGRSFDDRETD